MHIVNISSDSALEDISPPSFAEDHLRFTRHRFIDVTLPPYTSSYCSRHYFPRRHVRRYHQNMPTSLLIHETRNTMFDSPDAAVGFSGVVIITPRTTTLIGALILQFFGAGGRVGIPGGVGGGGGGEKQKNIAKTA